MGTRIRAAVVNGTGYGGVELLRLLHTHPAIDLIEVTARSEACQSLATVFPSLTGLDLRFSQLIAEANLVFVALPDDASVELVPRLLAEGRRVVDLSAAFRLRAAGLYPKWYGYEHAAPALLETAVYGLVEWNRAALPGATLVACPGCYPTATLLALLPAVARKLVEGDVIADAKSGVSGAGRSLKLTNHFSEVNENVAAYGVQGHRHLPEIEQELARAANEAQRITFIPHLVPMTRGILATCYASLRPGVSPASVREAYRAAYANTPCVRLADVPPHTKWSLGANRCYVYPTVDERTGRLIVISAIDNLVKGAAGQAIQCANLMYGLPETLGLPLEGVYP
jgi:N-acetyl-gamma-glutamyl-phosphate reductase